MLHYASGDVFVFCGATGPQLCMLYNMRLLQSSAVTGSKMAPALPHALQRTFELDRLDTCRAPPPGIHLASKADSTGGRSGSTCGCRLCIKLSTVDDWLDRSPDVIVIAVSCHQAMNSSLEKQRSEIASANKAAPAADWMSRLTPIEPSGSSLVVVKL